MRSAVVIVAAIAWATCARAQAPAAAPPAVGVTVAAASKTAGGATFTAPPGWGAQRGPSMVVLAAPEPDMHVAIVDVPQAADAKAAATAAWQIYRPGGAHPFKLLTSRPPRNGWEEQAVVDYETSPNEHLAVESIARRKGSAWTVAIVDGGEAIAEKRAAAIGLLIQSLRPEGYSRENFAGRSPRALGPAEVAALVDFARRSAAELDVPGVGLALIDHGKIVYEGGVGVREMGKPDPVDAHTLFMIASNTKGMSTLLLAKLVDEGKLSWDEPVTQVYPDFRLGSAATTRKVLIRHLVCACTGLPRKDYEWLFNTTAATPASTTFVQLAATEPTSAFGEAFQYNNLMASAAGFIGGHIAHPDRELGAAYDAAMQEMIFDPLGMHDTTFSMTGALAGPDHASPHGQDIDGRTRVVSQDVNYAIAPYRPAGGAWSSPHDMILYVQDELSQGVASDGKRVVSAANLLARRARGVPIGEDQWYGMGLMEDATWGVSVIHHGGDLKGYHSDIIAIPSAQVGAVILTNAENGPALRRPFMRRLLEILYNGAPEATGDVAASAKVIDAARVEFARRLVRPPAAADLTLLAPAYQNPDLGRLAVETKDGATWFKGKAVSSEVASRHNDDGTVSFVSIDPGVRGLEFVVGGPADNRTLTIRDGQHIYVFTKDAS
jgi:CubicO group peptidase (beta-lactamase class C family)